jgi:ribosomal subunit interface protein
MEEAMDITLLTHDVTLPQRFRDHVDERADKVIVLAERAHTFQVKVSRENSSRGGPSLDVVELTVVGKGPVIRAEARSEDKYRAFDEALDHLIKRLRRAKDKRSPHHGRQRQKGLAEISGNGFADIDVTPASVEILRRVETGTIEVIDGPEEDIPADEGHSPVMIREKVFPAEMLTSDEAVDLMELVGHDFYLYVDRDTEQPSVVYRRKGWQYGVISLDTSG